MLLDLSVAFDTIDHGILLKGLSSWFGEGGAVLNCFVSYLAERCQSVKTGSSISSLQKVNFGVRKESVLAPILFSLYTTHFS